MQDPQQKYNIYLTEESTDLQQQMKDQVLRMRRPDENAPRPYDAEYLPALSGISDDFDPGLRMAVYETNSRWIPQVRSKESLFEEIISQIRIPDFDSGNVLEFSGMVYIPSSGEYSLQIQTKHSAIVRIHDALLIDADFHRDVADVKKGNIRLASGFHPIRILMKKENNEKWDFQILAGQAGGSLSSLSQDVIFHSKND